MTCRVLSLDGGGIKGTFTASVLAELERMSGKRMVEHFDIITGTSTGGIIALGLGLGLTAKQLLEFYERSGPDIFPLTGMHRQLRFWHRLFGPRQPQASLRAALEAVFGSKLLGDSCCRLVIPSYEGVSGGVHLFKTGHDPSYKQDPSMLAVDVAMATAAAPTYFPAFLKNDGCAFVDGGVWANCPVMIGVTEAICVLKKDRHNVQVLSIGTTDELFNISEKRRSGGILTWNTGLIDLFMNAQSKAAIGQARIFTGRQPYRINETVTPGRFALDDASWIRELAALGITQARKHEKEVNQQFLSERCEPYQSVL